MEFYLFNNKQMNRNQLQTEYQLNISLEKRVIKHRIPETLLDGSQYEIMMTWILQHLDDLECHNSTKYMAKTYLDVYLSQQASILPDSLHLIAISVARLAVKFNESEKYPISFAQKMGSYRYLSEEFIRMENQILVALGFNLNFITPYHYLPIISKLIPLNKEILKEIDDLVDFACTLKQLATLSAGQMLLSILLYLAYCYDPEKIQIIKLYGSMYSRLSEVVLLLDQKASEGMDCQNTQ